MEIPLMIYRAGRKSVARLSDFLHVCSLVVLPLGAKFTWRIWLFMWCEAQWLFTVPHLSLADLCLFLLLIGYIKESPSQNRLTKIKLLTSNAHANVLSWVQTESGNAQPNTLEGLSAQYVGLRRGVLLKSWHFEQALLCDEVTFLETWPTSQSVDCQQL